MIPANSTRRLLMLTVAGVGLVAIILAIVGISTKRWVGVEGSTDQLNETIYSQVLPRVNAGINQIANSGAPPAVVSATISVIVKSAFDGVVANIGKNLEPTTYDLFEKSTNTTKRPEFSVPQGLIIAGLCCIFVGTVLAIIVGLLGLWRVVSIVPLLFLVLGPVLITIGYLLYAKIVVEDFGHELGTEVHLGYSLVLIVIASIIGYATAVLFAFTILHNHHHPKVNDSVVLMNAPSGTKRPIRAPTSDSTF